MKHAAVYFPHRETMDLFFLLLLPPFISDSPEGEGVEGEVKVKIEVEGRDR